MSTEPSYAYKASSFGAPLEFILKDEGLQWSIGRRTGTVRYDEIRRVRMSFRPVTMQTYRFMTEIWCEGTPRMRIASSTWRGVLEQARQDEAYSAFIVALHRRIAAAGGRAEFATGVPVFKYWLGLVVFVGIALGLAWLTARALSLAEWGGAALIGGFFVLFLWQFGSFFHRNRPGAYQPDSVPAVVLPRA